LAVRYTCWLASGGSDVSGSIVAAGVADGSAYSSTVYENWTDVNGVYSADPRIVGTAKSLEFLSFRLAGVMAVVVPSPVCVCVCVCVYRSRHQPYAHMVSW
jgi:aspartokinase